MRLRTLLALTSLVLLAFALFFTGCRKTSEDLPVGRIDKTAKFFSFAKNLNPSIQKIVATLRSKNNQIPFINDFVTKQGYALWDKAEAIPVRSSSFEIRSNHSRIADTTGSSDCVLIPLVRENEQQVHGALICLITADSTYINLLDGSKTKWYNENQNPSGITGDQLALLLMRLDKNVFGHKYFKIKDSAAFDTTVGKTTRFIQLASVSNSALVAGRWVSREITIPYITYEDLYEGQVHGCWPGQDDCNEYREVFHELTLYGYDWIDDYNPWNGEGGGGGVGGNGGGSYWGYHYNEEMPWEGIEPSNPDAIYVCNYPLSQHEQDVFNQLNQEDQTADDQHQNLDCMGTKRTGNINFTGTKEHWIIQLDYVSRNPAYGDAEFAIPGSSSAGNRGYADIVNLGDGGIFEIKPNNQPGITAGQSEVTNYVAKANMNCTSTLPAGVIWKKGTSYNVDIPSGINVPRYLPMNNLLGQYLEASYVAPGVIGYKYVNANPVPNPVVVPAPQVDNFKHLIDRLRGNMANADAIIAEYMHQHPELLTYIKGAIITTGAAIIVGTILEDVVTAGAGVADDWTCFVLAYRIIRFAVTY